MAIHREARALRKLTGEVVRWLHPLEPFRLSEDLWHWSAATWTDVCRVVHVQGLAAHLHQCLSGNPLAEDWPPSFRTWLANEYAMNTERVRILHEELADILAAARHVGISVMPLKGALLSTHYYADPGLRPLGDLDLLIQPAALPEMIEILRRLGYRAPPKRSLAERRYGNHFLFSNTKTPTVVSYTSEHPENPRTVEIHTALHRGMWGKLGSYDITELMWQNSVEGEILGEPVHLPTVSALFCHVAMHALRHFLGGDGRALQWLDLALLASHRPQIGKTYGNWVYPILRLASRGLPGRFDEQQFVALAQSVNPQLRQWAESVPLDTRCGLMMRFADQVQFQNSWSGRVQRHVGYWYPSPLRMALFAEDMSLAQAYRRFLLAYALHWRAWLGDQLHKDWAGRRSHAHKPAL